MAAKCSQRRPAGVGREGRSPQVLMAPLIQANGARRARRVWYVPGTAQARSRNGSRKPLIRDVAVPDPRARGLTYRRRDVIRSTPTIERA
jgi:hypothetical protein